jgi:3-deoxy-D-manno-octulosonic-acid transferase
LFLLYNVILACVALLALPLLVPWVFTCAKRRATVRQRLGLFPLSAMGNRKDAFRANRRIWVHALSVGEVLSALALVEQLRQCFKTDALFFSTSTQTGFAVAQSKLVSKVDALFYFPYDLLPVVRRVTRRVAPDLVILVETDIWPNFLFEMQRRRVPVFLVNARLSERSWRRYRRLVGLVRPLFGTLARVCTQTGRDAERFRQLGVARERVYATGNIKFDQASHPEMNANLQALHRYLKATPEQRTIVAGSTHPGEEDLIGQAWADLKRQIPGVKLILAPRDPSRAAEIRELFGRGGHEAVLWSEIFHHGTRVSFDVLLVDTIGLLGKLYALADIAIVGGSLGPFGGHNPLEPAAWSKPILFGSDMNDFRQIAQMLLAAGGAIQVTDAERLTPIMKKLLNDRQWSRDLGANAHLVFKRNQGTVAKTVAVISDYCRMELQWNRIDR